MSVGSVSAGHASGGPGSASALAAEGPGKGASAGTYRGASGGGAKANGGVKLSGIVGMGMFGPAGSIASAVLKFLGS